MAKNVIINEITYQNVPKVQIPLANSSGNAEFVDTSDGTLDSGDKLLSGNTAYANGIKYTGTIVTKDSTNMVVNGATVTAPAGYYAESSSATVDIGSATTPATSITANPTISVSANGLITATVSGSKSVTPTVTEGYVTSGTAGTVSVSGSKTEQLTTKGTATITPGTSNQTIATGTYITGTQTILGDADLQPQNIKSGINIFGVAGSLTSAVISQDTTTKVLSIS